MKFVELRDNKPRYTQEETTNWPCSFLGVWRRLLLLDRYSVIRVRKLEQLDFQ